MPNQRAFARDVHSALRRTLGVHLKTLGWRLRRGQTFALAGPAGRHRVPILWAQCSAHGEDWSGNRFTVNVGWHQSETAPLGGGCRPLMLLKEDAAGRGLALARAILAERPEPAADHWIWGAMAGEGQWGHFWKTAWAREREIDPKSWRAGADIWMNYYSPADVERWGGYLCDVIGQVLADAERQFLPE